MIIRHLWLKNFGKFHNRELELTDGITIIYGENESGKSTLHTFIQGIFFGIRRMRGRAAKNDVYSRYEPWENGGYYAGAIRFSCGGKTFRLTRNFQKDNQRAELVCEDDGELLSVEEGDLGVLLGNISQVVYDNTVSVGQLKGQTQEGLAAELRNYMSNYQSDTEGQIDIEKAVAALKEKKKAFQQARKEEMGKQEELLGSLKGKLLFLEEEKAELEAKIQDTRKRKEDLKHGKEKTDPDRPGSPTEKGRGKGAIGVSLLAGAVLILLSLLLFPSIPAKLAATVVSAGIMSLLLVRAKTLAYRAQERSEEENGSREAVGDGEEKRLEWKLEHLREEAEEKGTQCENLKEEYQELLMGLSHEITPVQEEIASLDLAISTIEELSKDIQSRMGSQLQRQISRILSELTGGKYTQLAISEEFQIHLNTDQHYIPLEQLSRGTIEQVYFALRMAVSDILCKEEPLPVLLDEPFAMYDEERLKNTLKWLSEHKEQVIIFTCQKREIRMLEEMGIEYHCVSL